MNNSITNNKRIAKNTIYLYVRMIVIMAITLFTSREILRILGVDDFGIYNVVAGVVVLFHFLQTGLTSAFQRYLAYDIGKGDERQVNRTFCMSVNACMCIAILVILVSETLGLWFVYTQLVIPCERINAALAVYHFTIFTFVFSIFRIPYNAAIVAYERMSFYAYISVIEAALKLFVIYLLLFLPYDRLFIYSLLLLIVSIIIFAIFFLYVNCKFKTCRYKYVWNKGYFFELISFSGWSMVAGIANMTAHQGGNFLLNMFSGLVANAAFGIANQVSIAIYAFSQNFQIAFSPQITKLYAMSEAKELYRLVFRSTLVSYYLILIIAVPFILKADFILGLWLESVPEYTVGFCVLILSYQLIDAFQAPLNTLIYSTGNIRNYNIWLSIIIFLNLPLAYLFLKSGFTLYIVLFLRAFINLLTAIIRIFYMNVLMDFPVKEYLKNVVMRMLPVTLLSFGIGILLSPIMSGRVFADILYIVVTIFITLLVVLLIGFTKGDREIALAYVKKRFS